MSMKGFVTAAAVAGSLLFGSAGVAQAQFGGFNPGAFIPSGGRVNPGGVINQGIGAIQAINRQQQIQERRRQQAIAAQQARQRRAAMQRTQAGRAQLAREDRAARQRARQQERLIMGIAGALFSGGGGGGYTRPTQGPGSGTRSCGAPDRNGALQWC